MGGTAVDVGTGVSVGSGVAVGGIGVGDGSGDGVRLGPVVGEAVRVAVGVGVNSAPRLRSWKKAIQMTPSAATTRAMEPSRDPFSTA